MLSRLIVAVALAAAPLSLAAQAAMSRAEAVAAAIARGARLGIARADTAAAFGRLLSARALPNPTLLTEYSKSAPQYHVSIELPFDYVWLRRTRVQSAEASRLAARYRLDFERAAAALDADTTYTRAIAALERARLSARTARDADSLRRMTASRRDAGDASDLDVELATVSAGQQANVATSDSLLYLSAVLDLQTVIGLGADRVALTLSDSLTAPPTLADTMIADGGAPLPVAAARASLESAALGVRLQRRSLLAGTGLTAGFETHDPAGDEKGILPTVGLALPLPFLNRNRGPIAEAQAEQARAEAELSLAQFETRSLIARTQRERSSALVRLDRDRALVASATRVAELSLTAYREGAFSLPNVLEAQRSAREVLGQYIDDLAAAWIATAALRVYTMTPKP